MFYLQTMSNNSFQYKRNIEIKHSIVFPEGMQRIALGVEYSGTVFKGFQKQTTAQNTVQAALEMALSSIANEPITLVCAGRTDTGVHATGQVIHFDTRSHRPTKAWIQGVNTHLPESVRVVWAKQVANEFHARFSALARTYRYVIYSAPVRSAILQKQVTWISDCLEVELMAEALQYLVGEHDFSAFRAAQCQARSPVRRLYSTRFFTKGSLLILEVRANAFLQHMVRNIVGSLLAVGRQQKTPSWLGELLIQRDRTLAAATASPYGLYLVDVEYPSCFDLPHRALGPVFLND